MNDEQLFRYVQHDDIASYEATGWIVVNDMADCHHGVHAVLMRDEQRVTAKRDGWRKICEAEGV